MKHRLWGIVCLGCILSTGCERSTGDHRGEGVAGADTVAARPDSAAPAPHSPEPLPIRVGDTLDLPRLSGPVLLADARGEHQVFHVQDSIRLRVSSPAGLRPVVAILYARGRKLCDEEAVVMAVPEARGRYRVTAVRTVWPSDRVTAIDVVRIGGQSFAHVGEDQCSGNAGYWYDELYALSSTGELVRVPMELEENPRLRAQFSPAVSGLKGGVSFAGSRPEFVFCGILGGKEIEGIVRGTLKLEGGFVRDNPDILTPRFRIVPDRIWRDDEYPDLCASPRQSG